MSEEISSQTNLVPKPYLSGKMKQLSSMSISDNPVDTEGDAESSHMDTSKHSVKPLETVPEKRARRLRESWFAASYFAQGFGNATKILLPLFLSERGVRVLLIGILSGLDDLALTFKIPIGIISDKYSLCGLGHRRPYVVLGLWVATLLWTACGILDVTEFSFGPFLALIILISFNREVYDKPLDAYANEVTSKSEVGRLQGTIMNGTRAVGILIGFLLQSRIADAGTYGWAAVFFVTGLLLFISSLWAFYVPRAEAKNKFQWRAFNELKRPNIMAHAAFMFFGGIPTNIFIVAGPLFLEDLGISTTNVAYYLALSAVVLVFGSVLFGYLLDKYRGSLEKIFYIITISGTVASFLFIVSAEVPSIASYVMYLWAIAVGIVSGGALGANYGLLMLEIRDPQISASFFSIFGTSASLGSLVGGLLSGVLIENVGYTYLNVFILALIVLQVPLIHFIFRGTNYGELTIEDVDASADETTLSDGGGNDLVSTDLEDTVGETHSGGGEVSEASSSVNEFGAKSVEVELVDVNPEGNAPTTNGNDKKSDSATRSDVDVREESLAHQDLDRETSTSTPTAGAKRTCDKESDIEDVGNQASDTEKESEITTEISLSNVKKQEEL